MGNQWEAIKYVSKRALQEVLGKNISGERPIAQDSILEEDRAREFFPDVHFSDRSCSPNEQPITSEKIAQPCWPATVSIKKNDFNDLLMTQGKSKMQALSQETPAQDLLTQYQALKAAKSQYNILKATPAEKQQMYGLTSQIEKVAAQIIKDEKLYQQAKQLGISQSMRLEAGLYERGARLTQGQTTSLLRSR